MQSVAIIDLGSNTARLVALEFEPERRFRMVDELRQLVRLSEGMGEERVIRPEPFERAIDALRTFRSYCDAARIRHVRATTTSAVRVAVNGDAFLKAARERAGVDLRVLSGEEEAGAGVLAVANSLPVSDAVVFDLGGGSMQVSAMRDRRFRVGRAYPFGAVRATEEYLSTDPPKPKQVKALTRAVRHALEDDLARLPRGAPVVGMGGTLRNLANVVQQADGYVPQLLHGYRLKRNRLAALVDDLLAMPLDARRAVGGLNRDRADIIVAGGIVIRTLLELLQADEVMISGQGLREGLFYPYLFPRGDHLAPDVRDFSVWNLEREYQGRPEHDGHVRDLAVQLFDDLRPRHGFGEAERRLLAAAAVVHDVGMVIDYYAHHKHGMYLVMGRPLAGFEHREQAIIALLVRYHRRGTPSEQGLGAVLEAGDMQRVRVLSGILRMAEYLDRAKSQRIEAVTCEDALASPLRIEAWSKTDAHVEVEMAQVRSELLADALGVPIDVVPATAPAVRS